MKILFVCRLYSGFEESVKTGVWLPKGAPTIARMIEHLDKSEDHQLNLIFTQKGTSKTRFDKTVKLQGLNTPATILAGMMNWPKWLWKFREKISDLTQFVQILRAVKSNKPDVVYCDRVNIFSAAMLSRFFGVKVIWRVMGVLEPMHIASKSESLRAKIQKWLWRSPFSAVICTLDGSGGGPWMKRVLSPSVPHHLLINGVHKHNKVDPVLPLPKDGVKMLFVGRLESLKGIQEFMDAFYRASDQFPNLNAVIAGDGSLMSSLIEEAKEKQLADRIHFLGSITAPQLKHVRQQCDFYVSLNKQGNLSNVNLEALSDYLPTIVPSSHDPVDIDTDTIIPEIVFLRFGEVGDQDALINAIGVMMDDKSRAQYHEAAQICANDILPSWARRVKQELEIYESIQ